MSKLVGFRLGGKMEYVNRNPPETRTHDRTGIPRFGAARKKICHEKESRLPPIPTISQGHESAASRFFEFGPELRFPRSTEVSATTISGWPDLCNKLSRTN